MNRLILPLIFACSLILRLAFAGQTDFGGDSIALYEQALDLYLHGKISPEGARVVYTHSALPGSLQQLILGLPLFLSKGMPIGPTLFTAFWNFVSSVLIFVLCRKWFPGIDQVVLALLVMFSPWGVVFTSIWNPSFLPLFCALFLMGLMLWLENRKLGLGGFLIGSCLVWSLQIHLSVILLAAMLGVVWALRLIPRLPGKRALLGVSAGAAVGALTLIPYFATASERLTGGGGFFRRNILLNPHHLLQFPKFFLRFLSFPTAEVSRFAGHGKGFTYYLLTLQEHPLLIPFACFTMGVSVWMVWLGLGFYFNRGNWMSLRSPRKSDGIKLVVLTIPFIAGFSFIFASKNPSAHTFWILFPISFYPLLRALETSRFLKLPSVAQRWLTLSFVAFGLIVAVPVYQKGYSDVSVDRMESLARQAAQGKETPGMDDTQKEGVKAISKALDHQREP